MKKQGYNPYLPSWEYVPPANPYVFNGRVYVYGSHDYFNGYVFCMGDYVLPGLHPLTTSATGGMRSDISQNLRPV